MTHPPQSALLRAALDAAARGWPVFPLRPGDKRPAGHPEPACPGTGRCANGHLKPEQRATTDPALIEACWTHRPYNVGIATGPAGLLVVDLDAPKNESKNDMPCGMTTFSALCERAGQAVPTTYRVRTAGGGWHLYFTAPAGVQLRNTAGKLGPYIDTRAHGGYVVAPGSTINRRTYDVADDAPVAPLPAWLVSALTRPPVPTAPLPTTPHVQNTSAYAAAALRNETTNVATAPQGSRNWTLTRAARALGRLIASGDLPRTVVEEALKEAGERCGLSPRDCAATITSALNWSIAHNPGRAA